MQPSISSLVHEPHPSLHTKSTEYQYPLSPTSQYSASRSGSDSSCCTDVQTTCSCEARSTRLPSISAMLAELPRQEQSPRESPQMTNTHISVPTHFSVPRLSFPPQSAYKGQSDYHTSSTSRPLYSPHASPPGSFAASPSGFYGSSAHAMTERYPCDSCNKSFSRPSSLRIHKHSHTGERPFVCSIPGCERAFSVRSNMRRHMKVHASED